VSPLRAVSGSTGLQWELLLGGMVIGHAAEYVSLGDMSRLVFGKVELNGMVGGHAAG
jgi:hypothetical protein